MGYTTWKLSQQSKRASEGKEITALRERVAELETEVSRLKREDFSHERIQNASLKLANSVLKEQLAACERDAARYRWLRNGEQWPAVFPDYDEPEPLRDGVLDAAIDAVMEGE